MFSHNGYGLETEAQELGPPGPGLQLLGPWSRAYIQVAKSNKHVAKCTINVLKMYNKYIKNVPNMSQHLSKIYTYNTQKYITSILDIYIYLVNTYMCVVNIYMPANLWNCVVNVTPVTKPPQYTEIGKHIVKSTFYYDFQFRFRVFFVIIHPISPIDCPWCTYV